MEPAQPGISPIFRDREPRSEVFREAGVIACGEGPAAPSARSTSGKADRSLGRDVNGIKCALIQAGQHIRGLHQAQADFWVGWEGNAAEALRGQELRLNAQGRQSSCCLLKSTYDTIDLRVPRVGCNKDPH